MSKSNNNNWPHDLYSWKSRTHLEGDVALDYHLGELLSSAETEVDFDVAITWNTQVATSAVRWAERPTDGDTHYEVLDYTTLGSLSYELTSHLINRVPRTELRFIDHLERSVSHVLRSVDSISGKPFRVYDPDRGVWVQEGDWLSARHHGTSVGTYVDTIINRYTTALNRTIDLFFAVVDAVAPMPGKPHPNATDDELAALNRAVRRRDALLDPLLDARKLVKAIFNGKYRVMRQDLRTRLAVAEEKWDADPRWLVVADGMIDLEEVYETGQVELKAFSPLVYATRSLDLSWTRGRRNAGVSEWERGVAKILPDAGVRDYLQKRYGAALLGRPGIAGKSMVWQYGVGDTAKSTIQECIAGERGVFGAYAIVTSSSSLTREGQRTGAGDRFMAYARGARFAIMSELPDGEMLDGEVVKRVTGGESVEGTAKYANAIRYFFTATLFMSSNHPPTLPPGDTAMAGRIHVVPFTHRFWVRSKHPEEWAAASPEDRADESWATRVLASSQERAAILAWVLEGLIKFGHEGLGDLPQAMQQAREEFVADADPVSTIVRSLLGEETGYEDHPWVRIYSDAEWAALGLRDGDGLTKGEMEVLIEARARETMRLSSFDAVPPKVIRAARRMFQERGSGEKKARVRGTSRTDTVLTRVRRADAEVPQDA